MESVTFEIEYPRWGQYMRVIATRMARQHGVPSEAEDLYQEACCCLVTTIRDYNQQERNVPFRAFLIVSLDRHLRGYCRWAGRDRRDVRRLEFLEDFDDLVGWWSADALQAAMDFETLLETARRGLGDGDTRIFDALLSISGLRTLARGATVFGVSRDELAAQLRIPAWRASAGIRAVVNSLRDAAVGLRIVEAG